MTNEQGGLLAMAQQDYDEQVGKLKTMESSLAECARQLREARAKAGGGGGDVAAEIDAQAKIIASEMVHSRLQLQLDQQRGLIKIAGENVERLRGQRDFYQKELADCDLALLTWLRNGRADRLRQLVTEAQALGAEFAESGASELAGLIRDALLALHPALGRHSALCTRRQRAAEGLARL